MQALFKIFCIFRDTSYKPSAKREQIAGETLAFQKLFALFWVGRQPANEEPLGSESRPRLVIRQPVNEEPPGSESRPRRFPIQNLFFQNQFLPIIYISTF